MRVADPNNIRLAMLGMVDGNGHPFSWSAIINGDYDAEAMAACGYPVIPQYLAAQPRENLGIPGARVTHVWCDDVADAHRVAKASCVPQVVSRAEEVIGQVDAVLIATDIGHEHVARARPFIEAGIPVFIDKPLVDNVDDLHQFIQWYEEGRPLLSTSCMRYAKEFQDLRERLGALGTLRLLTVSMAKSWERYGIHAIEAVYPILRAGGYTAVTHSGSVGRSIVHVTHEDGADVVLAVIDDLFGAFGHVHAYGTNGADQAIFGDTFTAFKTQLETFINYLRMGTCPFPFDETVEQMKLLIAGILSRQNGGQTISLNEIGV